SRAICPTPEPTEEQGVGAIAPWPYAIVFVQTMCIPSRIPNYAVPPVPSKTDRHRKLPGLPVSAPTMPVGHPAGATVWIRVPVGPTPDARAPGEQVLLPQAAERSPK